MTGSGPFDGAFGFLLDPAERVLENGSAVIVETHDLAIENGRRGSERTFSIAKFGKGRGEVTLASADEVQLTLLDLDEGPDPFPLHFVGIVIRLGGDSAVSASIGSTERVNQSS